jgi:hypothetical protein
LEESREWLHDQICESFGDGEAVLEFDPPLPVPASPSNAPPLVVVSGGNSSPDRFKAATVQMCQELYSAGLCPTCGGGKGVRTNRPWFIGYMKSDTDAAFTGYPVGDRLLFSERFLSLLTKKRTFPGHLATRASPKREEEILRIHRRTNGSVRRHPRQEAKRMVLSNM